MPHPTRICSLLAALALLASGCATAMPAAPAPPPPAAVLPDLVVDPVTDLAVAVSPSGQRLLVFSATISNLGPGSLELTGARDRGGWLLRQAVSKQAGDGVEWIRAFRPEMAFGGDGHGHWHIRDGAQYRLIALGSAEAVRYDRKAGFCFFDNTLTHPALARSGPQHASADCGGREVTRLTMGLASGWGDQYHWFLPGQSIDVTGLPDGRYRLEVEADPSRWFAEGRTDNNLGWLIFELRTDPVSGLGLVEPVEASPPS